MQEHIAVFVSCSAYLNSFSTENSDHVPGLRVLSGKLQESFCSFPVAHILGGIKGIQKIPIVIGYLPDLRAGRFDISGVLCVVPHIGACFVPAGHHKKIDIIGEIRIEHFREIVR